MAGERVLLVSDDLSWKRIVGKCISKVWEGVMVAEVGMGNMDEIRESIVGVQLLLIDLVSMKDYGFLYFRRQTGLDILRILVRENLLPPSVLAISDFTVEEVIRVSQLPRTCENLDVVSTNDSTNTSAEITTTILLLLQAAA